jgi:hypothetical protein
MLGHEFPLASFAIRESSPELLLSFVSSIESVQLAALPSASSGLALLVQSPDNAAEALEGRTSLIELRVDFAFFVVLSDNPVTNLPRPEFDSDDDPTSFIDDAT